MYLVTYMVILNTYGKFNIIIINESRTKEKGRREQGLFIINESRTKEKGTGIV